MAEINDTEIRIGEKAHQLFMQYGLRSVSMDDIAKDLGISKKTIYQFYEDKDALVDEVISKTFEHDQACCVRDKATSENAVHEIFLAIEFIVEMFKTMNPSVLYDLQKFHSLSFMRFVKHKDTFLYGMVYENLKRGIKEELYRPDINAEVLARFRVEAMMMPFQPDFKSKLKENLAVIEEVITLHYLFGLVTPKGYKLAIKYQEKRNKNNEK